MDADVGIITVRAVEIQDQREAADSSLLTVPDPREKTIRFKYRWEDLNNWSSGFFGINK